MAFLDIYGGSVGTETILTSKYSGSTSSVSKMVDFGPPGAEKLIFSDKTSSSLIDCSPKLISNYVILIFQRYLDQCHPRVINDLTGYFATKNYITTKIPQSMEVRENA